MKSLGKNVTTGSHQAYKVCDREQRVICCELSYINRNHYLRVVFACSILETNFNMPATKLTRQTVTIHDVQVDVSDRIIESFIKKHVPNAVKKTNRGTPYCTYLGN